MKAKLATNIEFLHSENDLDRLDNLFDTLSRKDGVNEQDLFDITCLAALRIKKVPLSMSGYSLGSWQTKAFLSGLVAVYPLADPQRREHMLSLIIDYVDHACQRVPAVANKDRLTETILIKVIGMGILGKEIITRFPDNALKRLVMDTSFDI